MLLVFYLNSPPYLKQKTSYKTIRGFHLCLQLLIDYFSILNTDMIV